MSSLNAEPPFPRSSRATDALLLGVRLLLAADLMRLCWRRFSTYEASVQDMEVYGFSSPETWIVVALLAGAVGAASILSGWRVRWGAALAGMGFMPVAMVFSGTYVPLGWPDFWKPLLTVAAFGEDVVLVFALALVFLFGGGRYTVPRGVRNVGKAVWVTRSSRSTVNRSAAESSSRTSKQAA